MNISSVVLRTRAGQLASVRHALGELPGVEVHATTEDGRIVATLEDAATFIRLYDIAGVMSVALIYQYSDEEASSPWN